MNHKIIPAFVLSSIGIFVLGSQALSPANAEGSLPPNILTRVVDDGADHVGANRVAADGADHAWESQIALTSERGRLGGIGSDAVASLR